MSSTPLAPRTVGQEALPGLQNLRQPTCPYFRLLTASYPPSRLGARRKREQAGRSMSSRTSSPSAVAQAIEMPLQNLRKTINHYM